MQKHTDVYGFYHHVTNPRHMSSENPSLFSGGIQSLRSIVGRPTEYIPYGYMKKNIGWVTHVTDKHPNFSHDEMSGQYIGRFLRGDTMTKLPIIKWDSQGVNDDKLRKYWLHPRDIICYLVFRNNPIGYLFSWFYVLTAIISFSAEREVTSGKCKHFYVAAAWTSAGNRLQSFLGRLILALGDILCEKEHGSLPFIDVFRIYFKDKEHISHELIGEYYAAIRFRTANKDTKGSEFSLTYYEKFKRTV